MTIKENEIKAIRNLIEMDGYFADCFRNDFETMANNIRNDFPIELGTSIQSKIDELKAKNLELCKMMIKEADYYNSNAMHNMVYNELGQNQLIRIKREMSIPLSDAEIDYLIDNLKD